MPVATAGNETDGEIEIVTGYPLEPRQRLAQDPPKYVQRIPRVHIEAYGGMQAHV